MTTTSRTASDQLAIDDLAGVRGKIITRSDPEYDAARAVYNGAVDRHPLAIVRCADVADVIACVAYARDSYSYRQLYEAAYTMHDRACDGRHDEAYNRYDDHAHLFFPPKHTHKKNAQKKSTHMD